jgi:CRP-like cAMP-binding protein
MYYSHSVEAYLKTISKTPLFAGVRSEEAASLVSDLRGGILTVQAGEIVIAAGAQIQGPVHIKLLLTGFLQLVRYDLDGNQSVIKCVLPGDIIGQTTAFCDLRQHEYTLIARENCEILQFSLPKNGGNGVKNWSQLSWNLLGMLSKYEQQQMERNDILSKRTVREKVLAYLLLEQKRHQSDCFEIPLTRQELADYLCVDRTTLSSVISALQKEGVIQTMRKRFRMLKLR